MRQIIIASLFLFFLSSCNKKNSNKEVLSDWVNDSLNIESRGVSSRWMDTINTNMAFALYRGDSCILRQVYLAKRQKVDIPVNVMNMPDGPVKITYKDSADYNGEYYIVNMDVLELHNKEGQMFSKATRLPK